MEIETERLIIRQFGKKDLDVKDIVEGLNNINVSKWLLVVPFPYTEKDSSWWINHCKDKYAKEKKKDYPFAIELKSEGKVIGGVGLSDIKKDQGTATIGYWMNEKYHKNGYGSEALREVLNFGFNKLGLRRIEAGVFVGNPSSGKLLEKFGAKQEGILRKARISKASGELKDEIVYGLLKEEFKF